MHLHLSPRIRFLLLGLLAMTIAGCGSASRQAAPTPTAASSAAPAQVIEADARVVPARGVALSLASGGIVQELLAHEGDNVEEGDVVARLSGYDLAAAGVAAAELERTSAQQAMDILIRDAPVRAAQAALDVANARDALREAERMHGYQQKGNRATAETIEAAEAELVLAQKEVDRAQQVFNRYESDPPNDATRAAALTALQAAKRQRDTAKANVNWYTGQPSDIDQAILDAKVALAAAQLASAETIANDWKDGPSAAELNLAKARLDSARARLAAAQATLRDTELKAPFRGVIVAMNLKIGEFAVAGIPVVWLADTSAWRVETTNLSEVDAVLLKEGDSVTLTFDALPDVEMGGRIESIRAFGELNQAELTYRVTISPLTTDPRLRWNMTAYATFRPTS